MVFNVNISAISWQFYWWRKLQVTNFIT